MKRQILLACLLIFVFAFSVVALSSCDIIGGIVNPTPDVDGDQDGDQTTDDKPEAAPKYTVTYVGGEGATGEAPAGATCKAGTVILLPGNTFTREGYLFAGWSLGDETYEADSVFTTPDSNVVFTAVWKEAPKVANEVTSVVIKDMTLTVAGTSAGTAKLFIGDTNRTDRNHLTDITVADDGSFSVSFDLNTLAADNDWYNTFVAFSDGSYKVVSLNQLTNGEGGSYELWSWINLSETKLQICSWDAEGTPTLSFKVEQVVAGSDYFLKGGQISASNKTVSIAEENGKVYFSFSDEFVGSDAAKTFELIFTTADPTDRPTSVDKVLYTASNVYEGDNVNAFSFKVNLTDDVGKNNDWIRFVLKVTEGDTVSYYTIKPLVASHNGTWVPFCDPITVEGMKHELAICWSSVFVQIK